MVKLIKYGNTNTFFICNIGKGILIDTDWAGKLSEFYKEIKNNEIAISDISCILITHYHPDHMGVVSELMEIGIRLVVIDIQQDFIHYSDKIFQRDKRLNYKPIIDENADIITCAESREYLKKFGIDGEIIHTPGHSDDSISVILDEGVAIVGDLDPIDVVDGYEDNKELKDSWKKVLYYHPSVVYYGHANPRYFG